jgi:nucleotide-binding universal stress UspA family protein
MTTLNDTSTLSPPLDVRQLDVPVDSADNRWRAWTLAQRLGARLGAAVVPLQVDPSSPWKDEDEHIVVPAMHGATSVRVIAGADVGARLVAFLEAHADSTFVMSTHGYTSLHTMVVPSTTEAVLRQAPREFVVVGPHYEAGLHGDPKRVVVCVDGSPLAESMVGTAGSWARALGVPVEIVEVVPPRAQTAPSDVVESGYAVGLARRLHAAGIDASWETLHGNHPAQTIVDYAGSQPGTLLAMTTHGRTGLSRILAGSVTLDVVRHSPTPVLLQRATYAE